MTLVSTFAYPSDIPWRRLAHSDDMMQRHGGELPPTFRSSVALYYYLPQLDEELYPGQRVVYLKVQASLAGLVPADEADPTVLVEDAGADESAAYAEYAGRRAEQYPCYGAVVHLAVLPPHGAEAPLADYPYIHDFEPKKRELYETISDTGEVVSESGSGMQIARAGSQIRNQESMVSQLTGAQWPMGGGAGGYGETSGQRLWGRTVEETNAVTADRSALARETQSHTTESTQMYQLLQSLHAGTNRAVHLINPRPHIVAQSIDLVNGPRQLEGIQEFVYIVLHPRSQRGLCVEATVETLHVDDFNEVGSWGQEGMTQGLFQRDYEFPRFQSLAAWDDRSRTNLVTLSPGEVLDDARPYDNVPLAESGHRWVNGPIHAEITHLRRHTWTDYRRWDGQNVDDGDRTAAQDKTDLAWGPRDATSLSFTWTWRDIGTRVRVEARTLRPIASAPKAGREYLATLRRVAGCLEFTPTVLARPEASAPPGIVTLAPLYQDRAEPAADFEAIRGGPMPVARANAAGRALAQVLRDYAGRPDLRKRAVAVPLAPLLVDRTVRKWLLADPKRRAARKAVVPEHILDRISSPEDRRRLAAATVQELAEGDHDGLLARAGIGLAERNEIVLATLGIRRAPKPSRAGR